MNSKLYYKENKESILLKKELYRKENPDKVKESQRQFYLKNKELKKQKVKQRYLLKKKEIIAKQVARRKELRKTNPFLKLKHNIRSLISMVLRANGFQKSSKTATLLCCSFEEFKIYIESLFDPTMTWENYGSVWTYDHICPCAQAQTEDELIKLQHYTNLRPYKDNFVKSDNKTPEGEQLCHQLLGRNWR